MYFLQKRIFVSIFEHFYRVFENQIFIFHFRKIFIIFFDKKNSVFYFYLFFANNIFISIQNKNCNLQKKVKIFSIWNNDFCFAKKKKNAKTWSESFFCFQWKLGKIYFHLFVCKYNFYFTFWKEFYQFSLETKFLFLLCKIFSQFHLPEKYFSFHFLSEFTILKQKVNIHSK